MNAIEQVRFARVVRPMKTLFATSLGRKSAATSVLVKVTLDSGAVGVGEAPTSFALKHETVPAIARVLRAVRGELIDLSIEDYAGKVTELRRRFPAFRMTVSGLEVALFRAWLADRGVSELEHWGGRTRKIETDITIPFIRDEEMLTNWLTRAVRTGFGSYKVKVSGNPLVDVKLVRTVRDFLHGHLSGHALKQSALGGHPSEDGAPSAHASKDSVTRGNPPTIRLDGNQGFREETYMRMIDLLDRNRIGIELFEQPLRKDDHVGLRNIRKRSAVPVILDETVCDSADCRRAIEEGLGDGVNIKIAKSGIADSAAIIDMAERAGLKLMIGCMTETMVGLSAGICMAAGTGAFDFVDLDSIHFLFHKAREGNITIAGPQYVL